MKLKQVGKNISVPEILNISKHGFWIFIDNREFFLDFKNYPWFKKASIESIMKVILLTKNHLYWEDLDIDLLLDSIKNPEQYPLIYRN